MLESGLASLNRLFQQGFDPDALLDPVIKQMEADLRKACRASVDVIASQQRLHYHCEDAQAEVNKWKRRVQLAMQKDDDYLAREALVRKEMHTKILNSLEVQLSQESASVQVLKSNIARLEIKICEVNSLNTILKVLRSEAYSQVSAELAETDLGRQVDLLKLASDLDGEPSLPQFLGSSQPIQPEFPDCSLTTLAGRGAVDVELENLKRMMDQL